MADIGNDGQKKMAITIEATGLVLRLDGGENAGPSWLLSKLTSSGLMRLNNSTQTVERMPRSILLVLNW